MSGYEKFYAVARRIPRGRVATYGQIAALAGVPNGARQVGYALHALRDGSRVPWHRVLNAKGEISLRPGSGHDRVQRALLEREGVAFDEQGRVDFERARWKPSARRPSRRSS